MVTLASSAPVARGALCSVAARLTGEDPLGTARRYERYVVIELATPWRGGRIAENEITAAFRRGAVAPRARGELFRSIYVTPDAEYSAAGTTRVLQFSRPRDPEVLLGAFARDEFVVPTDQAPALIEAVLASTADLAALDPFASCRVTSAGVQDLLVCVHGSVDACCGKFGFPAYDALRRHYRSDASVRVWRASHFGGHRFAPTLVEFPQARFWAQVDVPVMEAVLHQLGHPRLVRSHYRGWGGGQSAAAQVAEGAAFVQEGWAWTTYAQRHEVRGLPPGPEGQPRTRVTVHFASPDGGHSGRFEVVVEVTGSLPNLEDRCLAALDGHSSEAEHRIDQYRVVSLDAP